jgi:hypothetical protein
MGLLKNESLDGYLIMYFFALLAVTLSVSRLLNNPGFLLSIHQAQMHQLREYAAMPEPLPTQVWFDQQRLIISCKDIVDKYNSLGAGHLDKDGCK